MRKHGEEGVYVGLRGEVKTCSDMAAWRRNPTGVSWVQPVHCVLFFLTFLLSILNISLEISFYLLKQRSADTLSNGKLLCPGHPILLWDDNISKILNICIQLYRNLPSIGVLKYSPIVFNIVLDAVINI